MTYKEIVNRIQEVVQDHEILADFGYGALTDIKTVDDETRVNYPYAFLNPTQSTRTGQAITYRFNLIVMEVVQDDPTQKFSGYLKAQSNCQQYIDDILSRLRFYYTDQVDLTLNVSLTPFKERFQDTVAGMTATLEIVIPERLNECIAPFRTLLFQGKAGLGDKDYNSFGNPSPTVFPSYAIPELPAYYEIEFDVRFRINYDFSSYLATDKPVITVFQDASTPRVLGQPEFEMVVGEVQTVTFRGKFELEDIPPDNNDIFIQWGTQGEPFAPDAIEALEGNLYIYTA